MIDVYQILFPNGKSYIGITSEGIDKRRQRHYLDAKNNVPYKVYNAIRKYKGQEEWILIDSVSDWELACLIEISLIAALDTVKKGYNTTLGGQGRYGTRASKETKLKQRLAKLGKKAPERSKEWCRNISEAKKGEKNGQSKLTYDKVKAIKVMLKYGSYLKDIAVEFNISVTTVSNIKNNQRWAHVQ